LDNLIHAAGSLNNLELDVTEFEAFQFPRFNKKVKFLWKEEMFLHFDEDKDGNVDFKEFLEIQGLNEAGISKEKLEVGRKNKMDKLLF